MIGNILSKLNSPAIFTHLMSVKCKHFFFKLGSSEVITKKVESIRSWDSYFQNFSSPSYISGLCKYAKITFYSKAQHPLPNKRTFFFFLLVRGAENKDIIFLGQVLAVQVFYLPLFS